MPTLAEQIAAWIGATEPRALSPQTDDAAYRLLLDVAGLCDAMAQAERSVLLTCSCVATSEKVFGR